MTADQPTAVPDGATVYDVVIVGAGVIGAAIAIRATSAGKTVLMIDAGVSDALAWDEYSSYVDTFRMAATKATSTGYPANDAAPWPNALDIKGPVDKVIPPTKPMDDIYYVEAGPQPFRSDYIKMVGGTTLHWQGSSFRMLPNDFKLQSEYSVGVDWPLGYDDLEKYYEDAENQIGVAADVTDQTYSGIKFRDGYVYPMQRMPQSYVDQFLTGKIKDLTVTIDGKPYVAEGIPLPSGRNTEPNADYNYRREPGPIGYTPVGAVGDRDSGQRCQGNSSCMPICPVQAKYSAIKTVDMLLRNRSVVLQDRTIASSFVIDPATKRVLGLNVKRYSDPSSSRFMEDTVYGNTIVLAGNAIENAKLMLNNGIAQGNANLGANLMDHPYLYLWGKAPQAVYPFRGPDTTSGIDSLRDGPYRAKHSAFRASISNWGWSGSPKADLQGLVASGVYGSALRAQLADVLTRQMKLGIMLEQLPDPKNKVSVSGKWLDKFLEPRPVLNYDYSEYVLDGAAAAVSVVQQIFAAAGIVDKNPPATPTGTGPYGVNLVTHGSATYAIMGAGHIVGTHRIGADATRGVTDTNGLVFGYPNLYAVGCGSMVTIGTSNPTLTAVALAHKAGDAIVEALR